MRCTDAIAIDPQKVALMQAGKKYVSILISNPPLQSKPISDIQSPGDS